MPLQKALETCGLLAKHLRTYAPILAAIGGSGRKAVRQELLAQFAAQLLTDEAAWADLQKALGNLLGEPVETLDLPTLLEKLPEAWRVNRMGSVFGVCVQAGIFDRTDLANYVWVTANWKKRNDGK